MLFGGQLPELRCIGGETMVMGLGVEPTEGIRKLAELGDGSTGSLFMATILRVG